MAKKTFGFFGALLHPMSLVLMVFMGWMYAEWGGVYAALLLWGIGEFFHNCAHESRFWEDK